MDNERFDKLMKRIAGGEKEALREIYDAYKDTIYYNVYSVLGNDADTQDVANEVFIKLWTMAKAYKPGSGHKAWLSTICHNAAIDFLRKNGRELAYEQEEMEGLSDAKIDNAMAELEGEHYVSWVLSHLVPAEREVVHMKVVLEMTLKEIGETLGIPIGTVSWRYRKGIHKLRRCGYGTGF